jgi:hypothetical protein
VRFLIDEMPPPSLARDLRTLGHDALDVREVGLGNHPDRDILDVAARESRVVVTENFGDFTRLVDAALRDGLASAPVALVRRGHGPGGAIADRLARALDRWAREHPEPWVGPHWIALAD